MIIQCEKCQTRFRLDDSRVTDKGVKVRCTKCKHVFTVQKEAPEDQHFAAKSVPDAPVDSRAFKDTSTRSEPADFNSFETAAFDASAISFESDELYDAGAENGTAEAAKPVARGGEVDFSGFDFGDSDLEPDSTLLSAASVDDFTDFSIEPASAVTRKEAPQGLDFSDDDMFGAVVQPAPEVSAETISFDFEGDSFAESMDMSGKDSGGKRGTLFPLNTPGDAPFNLGEIDFGDELTSVAVQQVNPDDLKPSQEILFAPLAEAQDNSADDDLARSFLGEDSAGDQQELPPLSIASRRKQSPLFSALIAVTALLVISVLGYLAYSSFSPSKESAAPEAGKISLRAVKAAFIENDEEGELLVISGEALNEYPNPRAALQVKVTVYDAAGQSIATKSAYGGNPLTEEQIVVLPLDKIEAAMSNQFGDSLANMEVAPGKVVPFVVVLANLPKGAKDFGVQPAGSSVATGQQQ
ncbi:MAG: DUF3426 domain-containing protein [Desulfuromonadaceae bacterium]